MFFLTALGWMLRNILAWDKVEQNVRDVQFKSEI